MIWQIRESGDGKFVAEYGLEHSGGVLGPSGAGVTMPAFIVYRMAKFDSRRQAEQYVKREVLK